MFVVAAGRRCESRGGVGPHRCYAGAVTFGLLAGTGSLATAWLLIRSGNPVGLVGAVSGFSPDCLYSLIADH